MIDKVIIYFTKKRKISTVLYTQPLESYELVILMTYALYIWGCISITRSLTKCTLKWLGLFFKWHSLRIMTYKLRKVMAQNDTKNTKNWEDVCWAGDSRGILQMNSWQKTACSEIGFEILDWIPCRWTDWSGNWCIQDIADSVEHASPCQCGNGVVPKMKY